MKLRTITKLRNVVILAVISLLVASLTGNTTACAVTVPEPVIITYSLSSSNGYIQTSLAGIITNGTFTAPTTLRVGFLPVSDFGYRFDHWVINGQSYSFVGNQGIGIRASMDTTVVAVFVPDPTIPVPEPVPSPVMETTPSPVSEAPSRSENPTNTPEPEKESESETASEPAAGTTDENETDNATVPEEPVEEEAAPVTTEEAIGLDEFNTDVTESVEYLGNPFSKGVYARNVWDMQVYNGSIYLGHGNSSNQGPDTNAGPIDVIRYDPVSKKFVTEYTVAEEQIDVYRILDGVLTVPGHDPKESWALGNYYTTEDGVWTKHRTITKAIHTFDMVRYNGAIYAGTGTDSFSEVVKSIDNGKTWTAVTPNKRFYTINRRAYTLFTFKGDLYASSLLQNKSTLLNNLIKVSGNTTSIVNVSGPSLLEGVDPGAYIKLVKPTEVNGTLYYIAGQSANDQQHIPLAMYTTTDLKTAQRVNFEENAVVPYDLITRGSTVQVLTSMKSEDGYWNIVYKTENGNEWEEVLRFHSETFARSFEEMDGDYYFGLGTDTVEKSSATGNILKVNAANLR